MLSPIDQTLIETSDYLLTATDIHTVVAGNRKLGWYPKVRGLDPEDGVEIGVAWYPLEYEYKADAEQRAREIMKHVKQLRKAA